MNTEIDSAADHLNYRNSLTPAVSDVNFGGWLSGSSKYLTNLSHWLCDPQAACPAPFPLSVGKKPCGTAAHHGIVFSESCPACLRNNPVGFFSLDVLSVPPLRKCERIYILPRAGHVRRLSGEANNLCVVEQKSEQLPPARQKYSVLQY